MDSQIIWSPGVTLEAIERQVILTAFRFYRGNKTATANSLGIAVRTLDNKLASYKMLDEDEVKRKEDDRKQREEFLKRARGVQPDNINVTAIADGARNNHSEESRKEEKRDSAEQAGNNSKSGVHVESAQGPTAQQTVPMPQREKVQSVSPKPLASGRAGQAR